MGPGRRGGQGCWVSLQDQGFKARGAAWRRRLCAAGLMGLQAGFGGRDPSREELCAHSPLQGSPSPSLGKESGGLPSLSLHTPPAKLPLSAPWHPPSSPPVRLSSLSTGTWPVAGAYALLCGGPGGGPPVKGSPPTPGLTAPGGLPWPLLQGAGWLAWKKWAAIHGYWPAQRRLALEDVRDFLRVQDPAPAPRSQPVKKDGAE